MVATAHRAPIRGGGSWGGHATAFVPDDESDVGTFQHLDPQSGVAGWFLVKQQLRDPPVVLHPVVASHLAGVLEAQDLRQAQIGTHRTEGRFRMLRLDGEAGVVAGQEVLQHCGGLVDGPGIGQAQFGGQTVLEGPRRPFHPTLGLR